MKIKAFTLVETLVVITIFSLMFAVTFEILSQNRSAFNIGSTKQDLENLARQGLERMSRELYKTNSAYISVPNGGSDSEITFRVPIGYDAGGSLIWGANEPGLGEPPATGGWKIRYSLNASSQLIREVLNTSNNVVSTRVLATAVNNLTFSLSNNLLTNLLTISLTTQKTALGGRVLAQTFSSQVTFRN